ncbi:fructose-bisphospatase II [Cardiosporidium cionae]|uniref:fructose-bisphosphatase n=1 Tax=Cardiosporidium cionae TaxID=476202 RepID=A0ABQ7J6Y7_9APIC|nr:fructose-bisphospatase II [Cardiosporidium cionae]|eukprot:KAF8819460.1 fructose-bisphospatase II [Cardiosporidium cionae]
MFCRILTAIKLASKIVNRELRKAGLADILGEYGNENVQGEQQKKLDVLANQTFKQALQNRKVVCGICSEEEENFISVNENAHCVLLMDPLDGSSNIDVNVSVGTIFSIYRRLSPIGTPVASSDFLQPGRDQIAAGYVLYGSSTMLVFANKSSEVNGFTLDHSLGTFYLSHPSLIFPEQATVYSTNEGNLKSYPAGARAFFRYCQEGCRFSLRYIGSLVSDFHRNLLQGGIYVYPSTVKDKNGKLRLLYEANPMAFIAEKAGGAASNGFERILDIIPTQLHQRTSFIVGTRELVEIFDNFMKITPPDVEYQPSALH